MCLPCRWIWMKYSGSSNVNKGDFCVHMLSLQHLYKNCYLKSRHSRITTMWINSNGTMGFILWQKGSAMHLTGIHLATQSTLRTYFGKIIHTKITEITCALAQVKWNKHAPSYHSHWLIIKGVRNAQSSSSRILESEREQKNWGRRSACQASLNHEAVYHFFPHWNVPNLHATEPYVRTWVMMWEVRDPQETLCELEQGFFLLVGRGVYKWRWGWRWESLISLFLFSSSRVSQLPRNSVVTGVTAGPTVLNL